MRKVLFLSFICFSCAAVFAADKKIGSVDLLWVSAQLSAQERSDQTAFLKSLQSLGFKVSQRSDPAGAPVLVIPRVFATRLTVNQADSIKNWVDQGGFLIFDGSSVLSDRFGVVLSSPSENVEFVHNHLRGDDNTHFKDKPAVSFIATQPFSNVHVCYSVQGKPLAIAGEYGKGKVIYFSILYDDVSSAGYGRFNDLPMMIRFTFGLPTISTPKQLEAYFDPGEHLKESVDKTLARLQVIGVRAIHVGAWYDDGPAPYNYKALIEGAQARGIFVYAWFEWPHVSQTFWDENPGCREKTAALEDAHVDWRLLMNLQNPDCRKKAVGEAEKTLSRYKWDGVDVAEIYFEPVDGFKSPQTFTPLNDDVRKQFQSEHHVDPITLFQPGADKASADGFLVFRKRLSSELIEYFLKNIRKLDRRDHRHWEILLTLIDVSQSQQLADNIAIDLHAQLALTNKYDATPIIEDAFLQWSKPPNRYVALGETYKKLLKNKPFLIDINVVDGIHASQSSYATDRPQGTELLELVNAAATHASRVIIYSESTVSVDDWQILP